MYDTINLWLSFENITNFNLSKTLEKLSGITEHTRANETYISGYLKNYRVNISEQGVSLKGSLAKYFLSDNFKTLNRS